MSGLRAVWRFVRRGAVLTLGQSALIVALVALPILGFSGAMLVLQSAIPTQSELLTSIVASGQSKLQAVSAPDPALRQKPAGSARWDTKRDSNGRPADVAQDASWVTPQTVLPEGTRVLRFADSMATVQTANGIADLPVTLGPAWDPAMVGRFELTAGVAPRASNEIAVSQPTLARLGIALGDAVHFQRPLVGDFVVTAVLTDTRGPRSVQELFLPDAAFDGTPAEITPGQYSYYLPDLDLDRQQLIELNHAGFIGTSRTLAAQYGLKDWNPQSGVYLGVFLLIGVAVLFLTFEVLLLAGSAFFIGARARQRVLAIIASTGANRSTLIAIVTSTGAGLGLIAGLLGVGGGIGAGAIALAIADDGSFALFPGFHLEWPTQLAIVGFAVMVGLGASVVPALSVSKLDVVAALRGATRPAKPRRRRPIVGIAMTICGAAITLGAGFLLAGISAGWWDGTTAQTSWIGQHSTRLTTLLSYVLTGGLIITQIGLIVAAGLVLRAAGSLLSRLGIAPRLAGRDLERNRSRAVPAIASIMVTSSLAVLAMGFMASGAASDAANYTWTTNANQAVAYVGGAHSLTAQTEQDLSTIVARTLPTAGAFTVIDGAQTPDSAADPRTDPKLYAAPLVSAPNTCPDYNDAGGLQWSPASRDWRCTDDWALFDQSFDGVPTIVVGDESTLAAILGHTPSAAAQDSLADGGAVSLHRAFLSDDHIEFGWYSATSMSTLSNLKTRNSPDHAATVPAVLEKTSHPIGFGVVISPAAAKRLGITTTTRSVLTQLTRAPTQAERDAVFAATSAMSPGDPTLDTAVYGVEIENGPQNSSGPLVWTSLAASALIAIAAAVVALTLARQDGARDDAVFSAVGASPGARRQVALWQGTIIVGAGALLGTATATLAVYAVEGFNPTQVFAMPWLQLALGTVGLTLVVALGSWLFAERLRARSTRDVIA